MPEPLADRWHSRDLPVLFEIARALDAGVQPQRVVVAEALPHLERADVDVAFTALNPAYIESIPVEENPRARFSRYSFVRLTERGRRATGLWPREDDAASALVELLEQAAEGTTDEDDAGNLRKAGRLLKSVPGNVLADVTAALIRQQTGL